MFIPFAASAVVGVGVGLGLWRLAEIENAREAAEGITAVGGINSPWAQVEVSRHVTGSKHFWDELDSKFSPDEIAAVENDPRWGLFDELEPVPPSQFTTEQVGLMTERTQHLTPEQLGAMSEDDWLSMYEVHPVSSRVSAPSPPPSQPVSTPVSSRLHMTPESQVQPAVEVVATTPQTTGCSDRAVAWLQANQGAFPVPLPPPLVESYADRQALIKATSWVSKAIDAGVSQNKVVTVVFGTAKGTANYQRIVELYKEVKGND